MAYQWVSVQGGVIPKNAVFAGKDDNGKRNVYVARARIHGYLSTGKIVQGHPHAHLPLNGSEHSSPEYEVLTAPPNTLSWIRYTGQIPFGAIENGGHSKSGNKMYIGRTVHGGSTVPGNVVDSKYLYLPYGYKEHCYTGFEILVKNMYSDCCSEKFF